MPGDLDRSPKVNWVERHGGLPSYVERIAKHLLAKGWPMSRAIATAISTTKKWCAAGEVHQWPGVQRINLGSRAEACKAAAQWEALKARARAAKAADGDLDDDVFAAELAEHIRWDNPDPESSAADEVAAPARKAADSMDLALAYAEIVKTAPQADGSLLVHGRATDDSLDLDQQRCDPEWLKKAMPEWFKIGNIREQHDPKRAAGKAIEHEAAEGGGHLITARIVDPVAKVKCEAGVYTGFSIGVKGPRIAKSADAPGGVITDGKIVEVSLVDRPCNPNATLTLVKAAEPGWTGKPEDLDEERGLVRCEEVAEKGADPAADTASADKSADTDADTSAGTEPAETPATSDDTPPAADTGTDTDAVKSTDTAPTEKAQSTALARPEFDAEAAKSLVADVLKADTATDIADAEKAIGIIGGLIASEAGDLVKNPGQTYDIRLLLDAVTALRAFIHCEQAEARRDARGPGYAEMAADAATEAAQADLAKTADPDPAADKGPGTGAEAADTTKTVDVDDSDRSADLVKALTAALGDDDNPLRKMFVSIVEVSTKAAAQSVSSLTERLEKVEQMATPGGPALRRTEADHKAARRSHLTEEAARWRSLEQAAEDPHLRAGYGLKAAQAETAVKALAL